MFLIFVNHDASVDEVIKAAIARFWFIIHPFDDGNGRIARAISDMLPAGSERKLKSARWATMVKCSPQKALRDIADLMDKGILQQEEPGGRSPHYDLTDDRRLQQINQREYSQH